MNKYTYLIAFAILIVGGVSLYQEDDPRIGGDSTELGAAYDYCAGIYNGMAGVDLGDNERSVVVDGVTTNEGFKRVGCMLGRIGTTDAILNEITTTTPLMGRQSAEREDFSYSWSVTTGGGLTMTITED